jgi:DNA-binding HxlR family transcriptional regulator
VTTRERRYDFLADCPTRIGVDLLSNTWTVVVLHALRDGPRRPRHLLTDIGGITPKVLNETLRRLTRQRLVSRHPVAEAPPRVDYRLTDLGRSLLGPVDALAAWVHDHAHELAPDG